MLALPLVQDHTDHLFSSSVIHTSWCITFLIRSAWVNSTLPGHHHFIWSTTTLSCSSQLCFMHCRWSVPSLSVILSNCIELFAPLMTFVRASARFHAAWFTTVLLCSLCQFGARWLCQLSVQLIVPPTSPSQVRPVHCNCVRFIVTRFCVLLTTSRYCLSQPG